MSKIEILDTKVVGQRIDKIVKSAQAVGSDLHDVAVQCALHVREHGDTGLASRLIKELTNSGASASINIQGLRFWFGMACPMVIDRKTGNWKLMDKTSDTYTKYVDRMLLKTSGEAKDAAKGQPDQQTLGGRVFFVDWCADNPFWEDDAVKTSQRNNIRIMGLSQVIGLAYSIEQRVNKAKDDGMFLPESADAVNDFVAKLKAMTKDFEASHAVELVQEKRAATEFKIKLERGETDAAAEAATNAGKPEGAPEQNDTEDKAEIANVGGDVTQGLNTSDDDAKATGTEG